MKNKNVKVKGIFTYAEV